jgi:tRNA dimethylallyltransferase
LLPPAVFILGPTASGKTAASLALAERFPVEIISVDSALVYVGMDVGTAKPDAATRARIPHHLIDILPPTEPYSAGRFREDALRLAGEIAARGRVPLFVGGTMLYERALAHGLAELPAANPELRSRLDERARARGWPALHAELARVDPATAARLEPTDAQRIQRALEVFEATGTPLSTLHARASSAAAPLRAVRIALEPSDRAVLHRRIAQRFREMLANGLLAEVEELRRGHALNAGLPSMRAVGYRQAWEVLEGTLPAAALAERGIAATRQLAKRQLTWLRSRTDVERLDCLRADLADAVSSQVARFLGRNAQSSP